MARKKLVPDPIPRPADPSDVSTIDGLVKALFESLSFTIGAQPDYNRLRTLFHPQGQIIPPRTERDTQSEVLELEVYIRQWVEAIVFTGLERKGFIITEIARRIQSYGALGQVFVTFEGHHAPKGTNPIQRGIYSLQLLREKQRWSILSLTWDIERQNSPIPRAYLI
jgi:hypothetical protein